MPDIVLQAGEANPSDITLRDVTAAWGAWSATFSNAIVIPAEVATGTGAANAVAVTDAPTLVVVAGSGAAVNPAASVKPAAVLATGTGAAADATVTTASVTNASAGLAVGTGATAAAASVGPGLSAAAGAGAASDTTITSDLVWGPWSTTYSNNVAADVQTSGGRRWPLEMTWRESHTEAVAGCATGTGSARNPTIAIERDDDLVFILAA